MVEAKLTQASLIDSATNITALMVKEETKESVPRFRGTDAPMVLANPHPGFKLVDTRESKLLRSMLGKFFDAREYNFHLRTVLAVSSSATGTVNASIQNATLASNTEFASLSSLFNEFFVVGFDCHYEPNSMYNYPLTGTSATTVSSLPLGCSDLQHAAPFYTSQTAMAENHRFQLSNSGRPFDYSWRNSEKPSSTVAVPLASGQVTQSWAQVTDVASYTGTIQFISQSAPPALPASQVLGVFAVSWNLLFRVRL
jgi:hypothetical protein